MSQKRYACPCCNFLTLSEEPPGSFAICPVCYWEDDDAQFRDPTMAGGANRVSLDAAKKNFAAFGASSEPHRAAVRPPHADEISR